MGRDGQLLGLQATGEGRLTVENAIVNPASGELEPWDWPASGTVEMNCFLCHLPDANNDARLEALQQGDFEGAATATLQGTALLTERDGNYAWNEEAFDDDGNLRQPFIQLQDPTPANCGACHGVVHTDLSAPLILDEYASGAYSSLTTGQRPSAKCTCTTSTSGCGTGCRRPPSCCCS